MESILLYISGNQWGLKQVVLDPQRNVRILLNGQTRHGMQSADPAACDQPLAYYHRNGPLGDLFSTWRPPNTGARVAIIGLGVGALAAYAQPGQHFTFFEIDPGVAQIAANLRYFTFLSQCRGSYQIVLGDGHDELARSNDHIYDMIVLDAFTNDTVPEHLLSTDAIQLYLDKLGNAGLLVFHITNVHAELRPLLVERANQAGLVCLTCDDLTVRESARDSGKLPSQYAVLARNSTDLAGLAENPRWNTG